MNPYQEDYLTRMLPVFEKEPRPETLVVEEDLAVVQPLEEAMATEPAAPAIFDSIAALISQYLSCDQHQLTVLTLWVAHTWFFRVLRTSTYLNIRSPLPQSGKSICMMLIRQLSRRPTFATGASSESLKKYLLTEANRFDDNKFDETIFLDDCHHTFGLSERQPLVALFNSSSEAGPCYFAAPHEYYFFGPKAFAGNAPLPRSLAARCIPITLSRSRPSEVLKRFHAESFHNAAGKLVEKLAPWVNAHRAALVQAGENPPPDIPPGLTPREQACAEPLIHIADLVGGAWPEKVRIAISQILELAEDTLATYLLRDIRDLFSVQNDPECLCTQDLISGLREMEHRPWGAWGRTSGRKLGVMLHDFGITSRRMRGSSHNLRGYCFEQFQDAWERYLPPMTVCSGTKNSSGARSDAQFPIVINEMGGRAE